MTPLEVVALLGGTLGVSLFSALVFRLQLMWCAPSMPRPLSSSARPMEEPDWGPSRLTLIERLPLGRLGRAIWSLGRLAFAVTIVLIGVRFLAPGWISTTGIPFILDFYERDQATFSAITIVALVVIAGLAFHRDSGSTSPDKRESVGLVQWTARVLVTAIIAIIVMAIPTMCISNAIRTSVQPPYRSR